MKTQRSYVNARRGRGLLMSIALGMFSWSVPLSAQTAFEATYSFSEVVARQGDRTDPTPPPTVEGLECSSFQAVSAVADGLSEYSSQSKAFTFIGWPIHEGDSSEVGQPDPGRYYEVSLAAASGYEFQVEDVSFKIKRSATGPAYFCVRSSHDGFVGNLSARFDSRSDGIQVLDGNVFRAVNAYGTSSPSCVVSFSGTSSVSELTLRIYVWGATNSGGSFGLGEFKLTGMVNRTGTQSTEATVEDDPVTEATPTDTIVSPQLYRIPARPADCLHSTFRQLGTNLVRELEICLDRSYFDTALNIINPSSDRLLTFGGLSLNLADSLGADCSDRFQTVVSSLDQVEPGQAGLLQLRLFASAAATETDYVLSGTFSYDESGQSGTGVLCPVRVSLPRQSAYDIHYICGDTVWLFAGETTVGGTPLWVIPGESDTLRVDSSGLFPLFGSADGTRWDSVCTENVRDDVWTRPDSSLLGGPWLRHLEHRVRKWGAGYDSLPDLLAFDILSKRYVYSSEGTVAVVPMGQIRLEQALSDTDTVMDFTLEPEALLPAWQYAVSDSLLDASSTELISLQRLPDETALPSENVWLDASGGLHLFDSIAGGQAYRLAFRRLAVGPEPCLIELYDSICLGDAYLANGFDLPAQEAAGDFVFCDTLQAVSGADSIVCLYLNVCPVPPTPGPIVGDSLIVRAGDYCYTIQPVPEASFYVWTVFPPDWETSGSGEQITLSIPYSGSGRLSVRAENRCGRSEASTLNLTTTALTPAEVGRFSLYPNPTSDEIVLELNGIQGETTITVSDMAGRLLHSESKTVDSSDCTFRFSLSAYSQGMYMIGISNCNVHTAVKVEKE